MTLPPSASASRGGHAAAADAAGPLFADDLKPGMSFPGQSRALHDTAFRTFAALTGDAHPIHYDDDYARKTRFGARLAHGLLIAAVTALGATPLSSRLEESLIAFLGVEAKFLLPVLVGDTLATSFHVRDVKLNEKKQSGVVTFYIPVRNQRSETVAEVNQVYLLRMRGGGVA